MKPLHLDCKTISDAWFQLLYNIFDNSYIQQVQSGSFENSQYRIQYPGISLYIEHPDQDMVPYLPPHMGLPQPCTMESIQDYFTNYLMDPTPDENQTHKYASRIREPMGSTNQLDQIISVLKKTPLTNQMVLEVAKTDDIITCVDPTTGRIDPPCLRLVDFKVILVPPVKPCCGCETSYENCCQFSCICKDHMLTAHVYFRSWDLWAGFPTDMGSAELLKQYVASECGFRNGPLYAYSSGAHIYGYQEKFARIRTGKDNAIGSD